MKESITLRYIWLLSGSFMIVILLAVCNGSNIIPDNPDEETEIIPERSITFSLETAVRALPVTQLRGKSFGMKAYILDNLWVAAGYSAEPDANWNNMRIDCSDSGVCTYAPIQSWLGSRYYTLFGYYPYSTPGVTVSDANHESIPYIGYRLSVNDPTQHQDIMVTSTFDYAVLNTGQVRM